MDADMCDYHTLDMRPTRHIHHVSYGGDCRALELVLILRYSGIVLEKVAEYFCYNWKMRNREDVPDMEIPPELCLELLMAADYLDGRCQGGESLMERANIGTA